MTRTTITQARVLNPVTGEDSITDLTLALEHCHDIGSLRADGIYTRPAPATLDATGWLACPGFTDCYSRLREPGYSRKGTIESEAKAALAAGITRILCAPDTDPVIDSASTVELIRQKANAVRAVDILPMAALTQGLAGQQLTELATLHAAGCVAASQADVPISDTNVLLSAMEYAATFDIPLIMSPRDAFIAPEGCAHAGPTAARLGLPSIPVTAETVALTRLIELAREIQPRLHFSRLSCARSVDIVDAAKQAGLDITADVGIAHLFHSDEELAGFDVNLHSAVPFRSRADRQALRQGLASGVIDGICSDHAPHDTDAKLAPFPTADAGLSIYDTFLPLLLALPNVIDLSLVEVMARVSCGPQKALGRASATTLEQQIQQQGLVLIDPQAAVDFSADAFLSNGLNSPLLGTDPATVMQDKGGALAGSVKYVLHPAAVVDAPP